MFTVPVLSRYVAVSVTVPARLALNSPMPSGALLMVATSTLSTVHVVGRAFATALPLASFAMAL
jgi:hypothetical protein